MNRLALALVLLVAGCDLDEGPRYGDAVEAPAGATAAAETVRDIWADRLGIELPDPPAIQWFEGQCLHDSDDSKCVVGRTVFAGDVSIKGIARAPARVTAHELLHWAMFLARGTVDPAHADSLWDEVVDVTLACAPDFE